MMPNKKQLTNVIEWSLYLQREFNRRDDIFADENIFKAYEKNQLITQIFKDLINAKNLVALNKTIRLIRNKEMVRIALRDLTQSAELVEVIRDLSDLAQGLIAGTLEWHYKQACEKFGTPIGDTTKEPQKLLVIGMGKLGGKELNFSSDIDLIFAYPEKGYATNLAGKQTANSQFFIRLGQALNRSLSECTEDGFAYRVDMRLRPFGDTGPLAVSFKELESYYENHGRAWERYALVKARVLAGDIKKGQQLFNILKPFVYRKYIDFSNLDSLRELKHMIHVQVIKKEMFNNIKLGRGGIREIEFIIQSFQLVNGGKDTRLQTRSLLKGLQLCVDKNFLSKKQGQELKSAYLFLRKAENRLQQWNDQQVHSIPTDIKQQQILAQTMSFVDYAQFIEVLDYHRAIVQQQFDLTFETSNQNNTNDLSKTTDISIEWLKKSGFVEQDFIIEKIASFKELPVYKRAGSESIARFEQVLPIVLLQIASVNNKQETLHRIFSLFESILQRSVYLVLLIENKPAIENLVLLFSESIWLANTLIKTPVLLDQLLDSKILFKPLKAGNLYQDAMQIALHFQGDDEQFMNKIREWKNSQIFKVAASDITNHLPVMKVSDYLTWIAEAVLAAVAEYAWQFMLSRNGMPTGLQSEQRPLLILGYGKLGGIEFGYVSDIDIVFLYQGVNSLDKTTGVNGKKQLDNSLFFTRMTQKIISLISLVMPAGKLYEVDTRLRANGASGLIIGELRSFISYQENKAWTWEHQALVRARAIVGDKVGKASFNDFKQSFMQQPRNLMDLQQKVLEMRLKMRKSLDKSDSETFDLKQGEGGIVDIEFMVQYLVLGYANKYPELAKYSDNINSLAIIAKLNFLQDQQIKPKQITKLADIYCKYRSISHRLALQNVNSKVCYEEISTEREVVVDAWHKLMT